MHSIIKTSLLTGLSLLICSNLFAVSTAVCYDTDSKLMIHYDGTDASTSFTDSSASGHSLTANGNVQVDTAQSKFGGASGLFDGSGDYITAADSADWDLGTGDFTFDMWVRFNSNSAGQHFIDRNNNEFQIRFAANGKLTFLIEGAEPAQDTWSPNVNQWYHIAVIRSGTSVIIFVDGVSFASGTSSADVQGGTGIHIGVDAGVSAQAFNGWMDELRIVKGTAVWTAGFTPPSTAYTDCTATTSSQAGQQGVSGTLNFY